MADTTRKRPVCSFCGRPESPETGRIITSENGGSICRQCVDICSSLYRKQPGTQPKSEADRTGDYIAQLKIPAPADMKIKKE